MEYNGCWIGNGCQDDAPNAIRKGRRAGGCTFQGTTVLQSGFLQQVQVAVLEGGQVLPTVLVGEVYIEFDDALEIQISVNEFVSELLESFAKSRGVQSNTGDWRWSQLSLFGNPF